MKQKTISYCYADEIVLWQNCHLYWLPKSSIIVCFPKCILGDFLVVLDLFLEVILVSFALFLSRSFQWYIQPNQSTLSKQFLSSLKDYWPSHKWPNLSSQDQSFGTKSCKFRHKFHSFWASSSWLFWRNPLLKISFL